MRRTHCSLILLQNQNSTQRKMIRTLQIKKRRHAIELPRTRVIHVVMNRWGIYVLHVYASDIWVGPRNLASYAT